MQESCDPQSLTMPEPEHYPPAKERGHLWHSAFCSDMQRETCELGTIQCGTISLRSMLHEGQTVQHVPVYAQSSPKVLLARCHYRLENRHGHVSSAETTSGFEIARRDYRVAESALRSRYIDKHIARTTVTNHFCTHTALTLRSLLCSAQNAIFVH